MNTTTEQSSDLQHLITQFAITPDEIAEQAELSVEQVILALNPYYISRCPIIFLIKTYCAAETLLRRQGWEGKSCQLWRALLLPLVPPRTGNKG